MSSERFRRVVTGMDVDGKSTIVIDSAVPSMKGVGAGGLIWRTSTSPVDNSVYPDTENVAFSFDLMHSGSSVFIVHELPPGITAPMHATDTIDYIVILKGEIVLITETGEVRCGQGTFIVDRGINHAWRNDTAESVVMGVVILPANPVGRGRSDKLPG